MINKGKLFILLPGTIPIIQEHPVDWESNWKGFFNEMEITVKSFFSWMECDLQGIVKFIDFV